jgi:hypothetical protein
MGEGAGSPFESLRVEMYLDSEKVEKELKRIDGKVAKFDQRMKKFGDTFVKFGVVAGAAIGALGTKFIAAARGAEDAQRKFDAVFRSEAEGVRKWLGQLSKDFALNRTEVEGWLARAQDLFVPMGLARDEASKLSKKVVELSTKVAVFNGMSTDQVLNAMMQGMIGVTRSVRRYGIMITEARTQQKGFEMGLVDAKGEMSEQAKVLARLELMLDDSGDAMARAQSLMNGMRGNTQRLSTAVTEASEEIGKALAPALQDFVGMVVPAIRGIQQWVKENGSLVSAAATTIGRLAVYSTAIGGAARVIGKMTVAVKALAAAKMGMAAGLGGVAGVGLMAYAFIEQQRIAEMQAQATETIEATGKQLGKLFAKQLKDWQKQARKMRGITTKELLASIEDVILGAGPKAQVFAEEFAKAIKMTFEGSDALRRTMNEFQMRFSNALRPADEGGAADDAPIREVVATMKARYSELLEWEEERRTETEQRKGSLRVLRLEEALDRIHDSVQNGLNKEVSMVQNAMTKISQIRSNAMIKLLQTREGMLRKAASTEQAIWELERGDPALSEQERWDKTYDRVKDIIKDARDLASTGHEDLAKERLDQAASLATQLATGDEKSYGVRAQLAKDFLQDIQNEFDNLADIEIEKQEEIIDAADETLSKLGETQQEIKKMFDELNTELGELATEASDIKVEFDASQAFETIRGLKLAIQDLKTEMTGVGITGSGAADEDGVPTIEEMFEAVESGRLG